MHKICSFVYFVTIPILTENGTTAGTTTTADQDDSRSILPATPSQDYQSILPATVTTAPPYLDGAIFRQTKTATISENPSGRSGRQEPLQHCTTLSGRGTVCRTVCKAATEPQSHRSTALSNTHTSPTESHREPQRAI